MTISGRSQSVFPGTVIAGRTESDNIAFSQSGTIIALPVSVAVTPRRHTMKTMTIYIREDETPEEALARQMEQETVDLTARTSDCVVGCPDTGKPAWQAAQNVKCPRCGWTGRKEDLILKQEGPSLYLHCPECGVGSFQSG